MIFLVSATSPIFDKEKKFTAKAVHIMDNSLITVLKFFYLQNK
jgi:hypothetical protein